MQMGANHRSALADILQWRRDVRHFKTDAIEADVLARLRNAMDCAPAVGNARPWRVLQVDSPDLRTSMIDNFEAANKAAAEAYDRTKANAYKQLKLSGMKEAPVHLSIWTDTQPQEGAGLGRRTMPEMLAYSTVTAIHTLWLAARAENIGVGWVSILDPSSVKNLFDVPHSWTLTGYLCLGYPKEMSDTPLLHRNGWQENTATYWEIV